jgi:hypothetical protein
MFKSLITSGDAKTVKGQKLGYRTGIMYLAPAFASGVINVCPKASVGCMAMCLNTAGRGQMDMVQQVRLARTLFLKENPKAFEKQLETEVSKLIKSALRAGMIPAIRVNGTSDLPRLALPLAEKFPSIQFYDYSKLPKPWQRVKPNYDITFSRSETNEKDCLDALANGINVAVVFSTKKTEKLPDEFWGYEVINGDEHDLRFLDKKGVVVGLTAKGKAKRDTTGFVIQVSK